MLSKKGEQMKNNKILTILCSILFLSAIGCSEVRRFYYESGELKEEASYNKGKQEGLTKTYYVSGPLRWEANYKEGKQEGLTKEYYRNGEIFYIDTYKDDQLIKKKSYDETGKLVLEQDFAYKEKK